MIKSLTIISVKMPENTLYSPDGVKRNGTLVMATNAYFKPYEYYDNGKIVGIDADMAQAVADYLGMNLRLKIWN